MEKKTITQMMKCLLTDPEKVALAQELARAVHDRDDQEARMKEFCAQCKSEIARFQNVIQRATMMIHDGYEYRKVSCEVSYNVPERGMKTVTRTDTGETDVEPMTMQEKADLFCNTEESGEEPEEPGVGADDEDDSLSGEA